MKKFNKTLLAAALMVAAGAANAGIAINSATGAEAFLQAYDSTQGVTYDLDLGITLAQLNAGLANKTYNLSTDANWNTFHGAKFNAATTQFGVVDGYKLTTYFTSTLASPAVDTGTNLLKVSSAIELAANRINAGAPLSAAGSALAVDGTSDGTGQWADAAGSTNVLDNLWGVPGGSQSAAINYGSTGNFFSDVNVTGKGLVVTNIGAWTLAGNTLSFAIPTITPPAAVPLPAAVWMFGAGLMGVLRLNRRKSAAI
jgi:hypothetical protein